MELYKTEQTILKWCEKDGFQYLRVFAFRRATPVSTPRPYNVTSVWVSAIARRLCGYHHAYPYLCQVVDYLNVCSSYRLTLKYKCSVYNLRFILSCFVILNVLPLLF